MNGEPLKSDVEDSLSREPLQDAEDRPGFQGIRVEGAQMESWRVTLESVTFYF